MSHTVNDLVEDWLEQSQREDGDPLIYEVVREEPETAWVAILEILNRRMTEDQTGLLAAGPLEDLLSLHGSQFVERVEQEAERSPRFNHLLGGVWQSQMSEQIWQRVQAARRVEW